MYEKKYRYGHQEEHFGIFRRFEHAKNERTLLVFIHGGFWRQAVSLDYLSPLVEKITEQGYLTWQIEYSRVTPFNTATDILNSVRSAVSYYNLLAEEEKINIEQIILVGHSVGAQLAVWLTKYMQLPVAHIVSLAGVLDVNLMEKVHQSKEQMKNLSENPLRDFLRKEYDSLHLSISPYECLPLKVPQTVIHGLVDIEVPYGISKHYVKKAVSLGDEVNFIQDDYGDHYWIIQPNHPSGQKVIDTIIQILEK